MLRMLKRVEFQRPGRNAAIGRTQIVDRPVTGDGENPRSQNPAILIEGLSAIPDAQERFLDQVLGRSRVCLLYTSDAADE